MRRTFPFTASVFGRVTVSTPFLYVDTGRLKAIMTDWNLPSVGIFVVRPPGQHLARKVRVLTELMLEQFSETGRPK